VCILQPGGQGFEPPQVHQVPFRLAAHLMARQCAGFRPCCETRGKTGGRIRKHFLGESPALVESRSFGYLQCPPMASPCKKCGAEKTESVPHGVLYQLAQVFGYRLRMCSRCRRLRLFPLLSRPSAPVENPTKPDNPGGCPRCGSTDWRRSHCRFWERLIGRRRMVRCQACRARFPRPLPRSW
jgi:hypothetical protein